MGEAADDAYGAAMRDLESWDGWVDDHDRPDLEDWERCARAEHGLPYYPRRLAPDVRRTLIRLHREEQIKRIADLAKQIGLLPKP